MPVVFPCWRKRFVRASRTALLGLTSWKGEASWLHTCAQVQSGIARTGKWWGHQHVVDEAVQPDLMIFAKGIASGFPLAGLAGREDVFDVRPAPCPPPVGGTKGCAVLRCCWQAGHGLCSAYATSIVCGQ